MAGDTVSYVITIKTEGSGNSKKKAVAPTQNGQSAESGSTSNEGSGGIASAIQSIDKVRKLAPVAFALSAVDTIVSAKINRVSLQTGHQTYAERINYGYSIAKQVVGFAGNVAFGAAAGGPWGALAAGVISGVSSLIQITNTATDIAVNRAIEDTGIRQANLRAGTGRGRQGRDY